MNDESFPTLPVIGEAHRAYGVLTGLRLAQPEAEKWCAVATFRDEHGGVEDWLLPDGELFIALGVSLMRNADTALLGGAPVPLTICLADEVWTVAQKSTEPRSRGKLTVTTFTPKDKLDPEPTRQLGDNGFTDPLAGANFPE